MGYEYKLEINGVVRQRKTNEFRGGVIADIVEWLPLIRHTNESIVITVQKEKKRRF